MEPAAKEPTILVIFGATGDLARRKLLPALFHLYSNGYLPKEFALVGLSKDDLSGDSFRDFVREVIEASGSQYRPEELDQFLKKTHYQSGEFANTATYTSLAQTLSSIDKQSGTTCSNKLFYLAVPPAVYDTLFEHLSSSGLTIPCGGSEGWTPLDVSRPQVTAATPDSGREGGRLTGWTRVLVEKPFGKDLATAQALDEKLGSLFQEEQIFRIDHYLAKDTVQNIITFRFANAMFEPVWDHEDVASIGIRMWETIGVGERASFYEDIGALRDVGQNHLLQLLALVTMEDPKVLEAQAIRDARARVLQELVVPDAATLSQSVIRGQYHGYRDEAELTKDSATETFFRIGARLDNDRWRDVPITLEAGKKLSDSKVEIVITFKEPVSCVCPEEDQRHQNVLTIRIQPDAGIKLRFWVKKPGIDYELAPRDLSFFFEDGDDTAMPDAYEKVLYDCIRGDQTLFASTDEVNASWRFITPIIEQWGSLPLQTYEPGSEGPAA